MNLLYILDGKTPVPVDDVLEWAVWMEHGKLRQVAITEVGEGVTVSTVFLGIPYGPDYGDPYLFETMVFGGERSHECVRSRTWEVAQDTHNRVVASF